MTIEILPGTRVKVFDRRLYVDDVKTPLSQTMQPATVICRYGKPKITLVFSDMVLGPYPDLIDVVFDRDLRVSHGHFTDCVEILRKEDRR